VGVAEFGMSYSVLRACYVRHGSLLRVRDGDLFAGVVAP
jgi:hypothetical protein